MKFRSVIILTKSTEQCLPVVLYVVLYKVFLTFKSMNGIQKCDESNQIP